MRLRRLVLVLPLLGLLSSCREGDCGGGGPPHVLEGEWRAQSVQVDVADKLSIGTLLSGESVLHRMTSALFAQSFGVDVDDVLTDDGRYALNFWCEARGQFPCAVGDFSTECDLLGDDELVCDAPEWYHADTIDFVRID